MADGELAGPRTWPTCRATRLRRILIGMREDYVECVGHADLVPKSGDGLALAAATGGIGGMLSRDNFAAPTPVALGAG